MVVRRSPVRIRPARRMRGTTETMPASSAVVTVPNILSFARIALIPLFCWRSANERTRLWGILLFAVVGSTDWVDGYVARRTGQVSELGRILDPVADRLAMRAGLITCGNSRVFPLWGG